MNQFKQQLTLMSTAKALLDQVLRAAQANGLDQSRLAERAGLRPETVSRAKGRGTIDLHSLQVLAQAAGLELALMPAATPGNTTSTTLPRRSPLSDPKWGLAWSNPDAPDEALVHNALMHGNYDLLLQAVLGHGIDTVRARWQRTSGLLPARARQEVERKLSNIEKGLADAAA
jgi:transcriptional regulator with XRE-family HTH domain